MSDEEQINELHDEDHLAECGKCRRKLIEEAQDLELQNGLLGARNDVLVEDNKVLTDRVQCLETLLNEAMGRILALNRKIKATDNKF